MSRLTRSLVLAATLAAMTLAGPDRHRAGTTHRRRDPADAEPRAVAGTASH